jgi:ketosteroid isomerase-like protein
MVDIEKEKKIIYQQTQEWYELEDKKDLDTIMEKFISYDTIFQVPGIPPLVGKEAIRNFMPQFFENLISISGETTRIEVADSGDLAYNLLASTAMVNGPDGPVEDKQKTLIVWKKINGKWKAIAGSFSSDLS